MGDASGCPMCGQTCVVGPGDSLVQCPACRVGLKVVRAGGALTLTLADFESRLSAPPPPAAGGGLRELIAAGLCVAALWLWFTRQPKPGPSVSESAQPAPTVAGAPDAPASAPAPGGLPNAPARLQAQPQGAPRPENQPAFQGVLPSGREFAALFKIPGAAGASTSWTGMAGQRVPGSNWTLRAVSMRPTSAIIEVAGGARITLAAGETYVGGPRGVPAPQPVAPQQRLAQRQYGARLQAARRRQHHPAGSEPDDFDQPAAGPAAAPVAAGRPPNVSSVDASAPHMATLRNYGVSGCETVVMVTSIRCGPCQQTKPKAEQWAREHPQSRVVFAEIGQTPTGGINWAAPIVQANGIRGVPYLVILDTSGNVSVQGNDAHRVLGF